jgi:putative ABC transport system permease protein
MISVATAVALVLLAAVPIIVLSLYGTPQRLRPFWAIVRGALQLAALSLILAGIISRLDWVLVAVGVMAVAAIFVAARRIGFGRRGLVASVIGVVGGALVPASIVFGTGSLHFTPRYVLAFAGIIIGGAMSIVTLAGRTFRTATIAQWDEVEGWLALGATPRTATRQIAQRASFSALVPSVDQTRTTGLVVLPGAFVGAIFGGLSPFDAGVFQILVLAGILASGSIAAVATLLVLGDLRFKPVDELVGR